MNRLYLLYLENEVKAALAKKVPEGKLCLQSLSGLSNNPEIGRDSKFVDGIKSILQENQETSTLLRPFVSQIKVTLEKARRNIKRRIDYDQTQNQEEPISNEEPEIAPLFDLDVEESEQRGEEVVRK